MYKYYKNINLLSILLVLLLAFPLKAECDMTDFNIEELFFNESIVGYYLGGFDVSSGSSNVLLFEYLRIADPGLPPAAVKGRLPKTR